MSFITEKHCPCNGSGAIRHGEALEICSCPNPDVAAEEHVRALCHALRHLSPTPALKASGRCPQLFEGSR